MRKDEHQIATVDRYDGTYEIACTCGKLFFEQNADDARDAMDDHIASLFDETPAR